MFFFECVIHFIQEKLDLSCANTLRIRMQTSVKAVVPFSYVGHSVV